MKDNKISKRLIIVVLACAVSFSVVMTGCDTESKNELSSNNLYTVSDTSGNNDNDSNNTSAESEIVTESSAIEESEISIENSKDVSTNSTGESQKSNVISSKTYGTMSFDEAIKIIPDYNDVDVYYTENECYSDERSYNFVCYARIIKDAEKNNFEWQGKYYSFKNGDLIEIQSKYPPEVNPSDHKYRVNTYVGDYILGTGMKVSFFPETLEFLEPGYTPTEKDNVVIYSTNSTQEESNDISYGSTESKWIVKNYVDEFGDQTGEKFLAIGSSDGKYTWNGIDNKLTVVLIVDKKYAAIMLYEYGSSQANNIFSSDNDYIIKIKDSSGNTKTFDGVMYANGGDRVIIKDYSGFLSILKNGEDTKFYVESNINAKYNFTLNLNGFAEVYSQL